MNTVCFDPVKTMLWLDLEIWEATSKLGKLSHMCQAVGYV